jgi:hypothetical protein
MAVVSGKFMARRDQVDSGALSPFPPHSIVLAASMHLRLWRETGAARHLEQVDELLDMIRLFGTRWLGASEFYFHFSGLVDRGKGAVWGLC